MPTGYTEDVRNGKITKFSDYAKQCSRAFGAMIELRDEVLSPEIPSEFKPSPYHRDRLAEAEAEKTRLATMTQKQIEDAAEAHNAQALASYHRSRNDISMHRARYNAMLDAVRAWQPPTPEHWGLKDFMISQLTMSIEQDCCETYVNRPDPISAQAWHKKAVADNASSIAWHEEHWQKEQERAKSRTAWVYALLKSLT